MKELCCLLLYIIVKINNCKVIINLDKHCCNEFVIFIAPVECGGLSVETTFYK